VLDARESNRIGISATPATDRRNSTGSYAGNVASGLVWLFGYEEIGFLKFKQDDAPRRLW